MHLFGHSPDGANAWDFHPPPNWEDKTIAMQGFGFDGRCVWLSRVVSASLEMPAILTDLISCLRFSFYPIRTTVTDAVKAGKTPIEWYSHPGACFTFTTSAPLFCLPH